MPWIFGLIPIELLILIVIGFLLLNEYFRRKWSVLKTWNIPHDPPSMKNLGHLRTVLADPDYMLKNKEKYGPVWGYYTVAFPRVVIHDLDLLQEIFIRDFSHFPNRQETLRRLQGDQLANGLLFALHDNWKRMRWTMTPSFSTHKLKQMFKIVDWCVDNTVINLKGISATDSATFYAKDVFSKLSLDVISSCAFSTDVNSQDTSKAESEVSIQAKKYVDAGFFRLFFQIGVFLPFLEPYIAKILDSRKHAVFFQNLVKKLIKSRDEDGIRDERVDLMQLMLDAKVDSVKDGDTKGMLLEEIVGNSVTMFMAGYETTSTAMTFLAYNLARHPDIQRRLQAEIQEMYEVAGGFNYDCIQELKYLDLCVKENLRLYCPVGTTKRVSHKLITTKDGQTIPSGIDIYVPIYALCHDPEYWEDPLEFNPERMENFDEVNPMVFAPFGAGPRNCIGKKLAFMEIKIAFCKLLHNFTFEAIPLTPKHPIKLQYTLTANFDDFQLKVVPYKRSRSSNEST